MVQHQSSLATNQPSVVHHQSYQAPAHPQQPQATFPQLNSGLAVLSFLPSDDPIASRNKAMATIQDGRVMVQNVQGRQSQGYVSSGSRGHMARAVLDEEQMAFLADNRDTVTTVSTGQGYQELTIPSIFQTDDLDAFDSDCDEAPSASVVLMAKLSAYDSNVLSEYYEQAPFIDDLNIESDSNVILYEKYLKTRLFKLSAKHAFWLPNSKPTSEKPPIQPEPVLKEIPRELPTISLVKDSFNKMRSHANNFDKVITVRTKFTGQNEGTWGFEHIRGAFKKDVIPFAKTIKEYFQMFDQGLAKEITEMKEFFNQMEIEVHKCFVQRKCFEIEEKELLIKNERLLEHILYQDVMCISMHVDVENTCVMPTISDNIAYAEMEQSYIDEYGKVLELEAKLSKKKNVVEKVAYDELSNRYLPLLSPKLKRNREAHVDYLQKAKEYADTLSDIVEQAKALTPLDNALEYACKFTTRIQELLVYVNATCPSSPNKNEKLAASAKTNKSKTFRFEEPRKSTSDTPNQTDSRNSKITNPPFLNSTGVKITTSGSGSQPSGNTKKNKISCTTRSIQKNKVEEHLRSVKSSFNKKNRVSECNANSKTNVLKANSKFVCKTCNECLFNACYDLCVVDYLNTVNKRAKSRSAKRNKKQEWKPTIVPPKKPVPAKVVKKTPPSSNKIRKPNATNVSSSSKSKSVDSKISNNSEPNKNWRSNVSTSSSSSRVHSSKFMGTVRFGNDHVAAIVGYEDYQIGNVTISQVYFVEGLGYNLFSVGQFCDSDLEVAFRKHTCFVRDLEASKTKSGLWHRRLSHLNFGTINELAKQGLVRGIPKLKYQKDHLCFACALRKSKKHTHKPKSEDSIQEKLYLLHMDLCGPTRVESINGKKHILVIVKDYSWFTWVKYIRSKDGTLKFVIKFLKQIQVRLNATVRNIRTDNGTEFINQTLKSYYEDVGISYQTLVARTLQQNDVVERRNRTLVEAARTMLIFSNAPLYLWVEAVATTCFTQNHSLIRKRHNKTPYELLHDKKSDLTYFYVFGALCYPTNDSEDLSKLKPKANIGIFIDYSPAKKAC
ncbi:retrovirus-related pol polyprotein from transposon TNT 1-94 [Tanacetum coccineum]